MAATVLPLTGHYSKRAGASTLERLPPPPHRPGWTDTEDMHSQELTSPQRPRWVATGAWTHPLGYHPGPQLGLRLTHPLLHLEPSGTGEGTTGPVKRYPHDPLHQFWCHPFTGAMLIFFVPILANVLQKQAPQEIFKTWDPPPKETKLHWFGSSLPTKQNKTILLMLSAHTCTMS